MQLAERLDRQEQIAFAAAREQRRLDGEDPVVGACLCGGEIQRRADEDVPEPVDLLVALAEPAQQFREGLVTVA